MSAALLFVTVSIPALAVNPGDEGKLATAQRTEASVDGQKLEIDGDVIAAPLTSDDAYTTGFAQTSGSYAQTASTFVNYSGPVQWPFLTGVPISTDFGPRVAPCGGCSTYHKGIDMNPGNGSPIQAIAAGVVREVSTTDNGGLGVYAVIDHVVDGEPVSSVYAHMREGSLALTVGQQVDVGDLVGNVGNTGQSTGPHLHFEILLGGDAPTDPIRWLSERVGR